MLIAEKEKSFFHSVSDVLSEDIYLKLFPKHLEVVPQLTEVYELELAFYERRMLSHEEIIRNGAYFAGVAMTLHAIFLSAVASRSDCRTIRLHDYVHLFEQTSSKHDMQPTVCSRTGGSFIPK